MINGSRNGFGCPGRLRIDGARKRGQIYRRRLQAIFRQAGDFPKRQVAGIRPAKKIGEHLPQITQAPQLGGMPLIVGQNDEEVGFRNPEVLAVLANLTFQRAPRIVVDRLAASGPA